MMLPAGVSAPGVASPFMALLSEMTHALLPLYLAGAPGADRLGEGFRGASRDALVANLIPREQHGRA